MDRLLSLRLSQLYYIYYFNGQEDPYLNIFEFIKKVEDELSHTSVWFKTDHEWGMEKIPQITARLGPKKL